MSIRRPLAAAAALLLAVSACSESRPAPLAPDVPPAALLGSGISLTGLLQFSSLPDLTASRYAEKRIVASEGGFVELNGFRVDIPAGALPADTVVSITLPLDAVLGKRLIAEFKPHGIQFSTPATLTFPLSGVSLNGNAVGVARWESGAWNTIGGTVSGDSTTLSATTPHFSYYSGKYVMAGG